jgi:hypothetical protein
MALCRFKLSDDDYKEFKARCKDQKLKVSDVLRSMVGEYLGHKIKVRVYGELNRGHNIDTNRGHNMDSELNRGHNRGHNIEDNEIVATNSKYPIFNDDGTIKEYITIDQ